MRTYDAIMADARPEPPHVDIVEWIAGVCDSCINDPGSDNLSPAEPGCPIILAMYQQRTPTELLKQPPDAPDGYHCVEYRGPDDGDGEPEPIPEPPDQPGLFPREPYAGVRMYTDMTPTHNHRNVPTIANQPQETVS